MARHDPNPFADEEINPFANYTNVPPANNSYLKPLPPEPYDRGATVDIPLDSGKDLRAREMELQAKENELKRKEQELKRREDAIARTGVVIEEKNWPEFFPLIHNDIPNEIPLHLQKIQYVAFTTLLGLVGSLLWNFVAVTVAWIKGEGPTIWLMSIIYFIAGVPGAYVLWYRPLYRATRTDSALKFGAFFFFYVFHIAFCGFAAVAPPVIFQGKSLTGFLPALELLTTNAAVGVSITSAPSQVLNFSLLATVLPSFFSPTDNVLHWSRVLLCRNTPQYLGDTASICILPREWQSCRDEA
ncbi:secretory carrier-associated membrane protein 2 isoform X1 [Brassica napus]|uniref:secretory carrier-associated membrane protein 2 isoform X2 n=1 Tax=Brassica oleracea var. oleracea TaxID=109376 RepID=UPI0006A6AC73|nr:PREDICTED: secretory carrier-associated membrane protein 2 isoform X2 [Brassica oleracea var. oleracea]XP_048621939.1 secretory carrier-associated membrane protein 2 isoform X1 [Brassica napus]